MSAVLRQTGALFFDAYRELNAKKLFWVVLGLSVLFVGVFALVGINDKGLTLLWWTIPIPMFNATVLPSKAFFYKFIFINFGFQLWLTWAATILALISTAPLIPEFVASGSVDLLLAKPISRVRLFYTKYLTGLLFAALQVALFSVAAFLVIGLRGGEWVARVFLAVPLVLLFFSFLYCVSALIGLLTRSTITALLGAIIFWFVIFVIQAAELGVLGQRVQQDLAVQVNSANKGIQERQLESLGGKLEGASEEERPAIQKQIADTRATLAATATNLGEAEKDQKFWNRWHSLMYSVKTILPKTGETMKLLERSLISGTELDFLMKDDAKGPERGGPFNHEQRVHGVKVSQRQLQRMLNDEIRGRSVWWVLGTSVGFELVLLGFAGIVFARRDF
jgi:ABC-type transport system involved in multi-copper enzyme maturation permease subunit